MEREPTIDTVADGRIRRLRQLTECSLTLAGDPAEVFGKTAAMIGELMSVPIVCLSEIRGEELHFLAVYDRGEVQHDVGRCPLSITPCATVRESREVRVYHDVATLFPEAEFLRQVGAHSYCGLPAVDGTGNVTAVVCLLDPNRHEYSEEDKDLLRLCSQRVALEIERQANRRKRQRAERALQESETRLKTIFDNTLDGILIVDVDTLQAVIGNAAMCRMLGRTSEELRQLPMRKMHPSAELSDVLEQFERHARGERSVAVEIPVERKDGSVFYADIATSPAELEGRQCLVGVFRDSSERREFHEALRQSEERFRSSFDNAPIGMAIVGLDQRILQVNEALCEILGYTRAELLVTTVDAITHPDDRDAEADQKHDMIAGGTARSQMTKRYLRADGQVVTGKLSVSLVADLEGEPLYFIGQLEDVTQQRQAELRLRDAENRYRILFEQSPDAIVIVDPETQRPIEFNRRILELLGYTAEEFGQLVIRDFEVAALPVDVEDPIARMWRQGEDRYETQLRRKNGQVIDVFVAVRILELDGKRVFHHILRDITEQKQLELQLLHSQKMEALGTLAGGIAHDFNNILSPIIGYTELTMRALPEESDSRGLLQEVLAAGVRAKDLVKRILTFSRTSEHERRTLRIQPLIDEALQLLRASIPTTIEIRTEVDPECGPVWADPTQIHQIVVNLCTNAYQAVGDRSGTLRIHLAEVTWSPGEAAARGALPAGSYVELIIADSGHGMDSDVALRIFEPYFTTKADGKGTGLGLSVVHGIVENHGGHIEVRTEPGRGTAIHVYLPRTEDPGEELRPPHDRSLARGRSRVLLVDDEEAIVRLLRRVLEDLGHEVTSFTDSTEALETYTERPDAFDLVVTDETMPEVPGSTLARRVQEIRPEVPVILCTGYSSAIPAEGTEGPGIRRVLRKPVALAELARVVSELAR